MKKTHLLRLIWIVVVLAGLPVLWQLSGMDSPAAGLPMGRVALSGLASLAWLFLAFGGGWAILPAFRAELFIERGAAWFTRSGRYPAVLAALLLIGLLSFEGFLFTFMFWPVYVRGLTVWGLLIACQGWVALRRVLRPAGSSRGSVWPRLSSLESGQIKVLLVLGLVGLAYFAAFVPFNLTGAEDAGRFLVNGGDEVVIYPILTTMLTPAPDLRTTLYRLIEYDDYHYGYPFYALSALTILPGRIILGAGFETAYQLNLFLLRQLISLLPLILSAIIFSYLATRFRSLPAALMVFVLILSIPGVVRTGLRFWHPDGLTVLFVALTFFYLQRDRLRFGRNFFMAALFCGLCAATRVVGFFFVLAVGGYLLVGWLRERSWLRSLTASCGFLAVLVVTILVTDPFLFDAGARGRMLATMAEKSGEMARGYAEPDPERVYRTGWDAWAPFFERDYAQTWFSGFLLFSSVLAALVVKERTFPALLLGWGVVMGGYLVFFVAAKAFQYSLPLFMPFYSAAFLLPQVFSARSHLQNSLKPRWVQKAVMGTTFGLCLIQLVINLVKIGSL